MWIINNEDYLMHHGIDGQKWGVRNGPPYPLTPVDKWSVSGKMTGKAMYKDIIKASVAVNEELNKMFKLDCDNGFRYPTSDEKSDSKKYNKYLKEMAKHVFISDKRKFASVNKKSRITSDLKRMNKQISEKYNMLSAEDKRIADNKLKGKYFKGKTGLTVSNFVKGNTYDANIAAWIVRQPAIDKGVKATQIWTFIGGPILGAALGLQVTSRYGDITKGW